MIALLPHSLGLVGAYAGEREMFENRKRGKWGQRKKREKRKKERGCVGERDTEKRGNERDSHYWYQREKRDLNRYSPAGAREI